MDALLLERKNSKVVSEDLMKYEIVSEQLTRHCKLLPINLNFALQKLFLNVNVYFFVVELIGTAILFLIDHELLYLCRTILAFVH